MRSPESAFDGRSDGGMSEGEVGEEQYETPMTSPGSSPLREDYEMGRGERREYGIVQYDGGVEGLDEDVEAHLRAETDCEVGMAMEDNLKESEATFPLLADSGSASARTETQPASQHQDEYFDLPTSSALSSETNQAAQLDLDDITPLVPASPAKGATSYPFPHQSDPIDPRTNRARLRYPSALLKHCEGKATPRQRRLMTTGVQTPDRFIPSRAATPTKEALLLPKPATKLAPPGKRIISQGVLEDSFGPTPRRSLRMAEQYATIRHPPPAPPRSVGMLGSRVQDAQQQSPTTTTRRAASAGTIWTVGGSMVTEGVASITNGRGGRVTSGCSAPHYTADFLRKGSQSEEEVMHGRRLAVAMEVEPGVRIMEQSLSGSVKTGAITVKSAGREGERVWKNGGWEVEGGIVSPSKVKARKKKEVPVIPFRVLDAPALRDDYYCSLLAYSPTVECLAVGLGPHVYLWSESRGKTNIPDSLTAPVGTAHVTSVSFSSQEGGSGVLAIGRADGRITLWSPLDRDPRFDSEQPAPVSCVSFRPTTVRRQSLRDPIATVATEELLVGDETGSVYFYSVEWPDQDQRDLFDWHGSMTLLARISCHAQQICGIAWSPDGEAFATGGNDNQLFLFESKKVLRVTPKHRQHASTRTAHVHVRSGSSSGSSNAIVAGQGEVLSVLPGQEKHVFNLNAAVKAIAFAPWQPTLLAAGGGSNDRCIHFFHTLSGAPLATIDCHAQVTSLVWSSRRKEIAVTFGFAQPEHPYRVAVFTWPGCGMVVGIPWFGEERALFAVSYPRGPSTGHPHRRYRNRDQGGIRGGGASVDRAADTEGQPWYGKRTREEGCLVVATSDASIKFHEIWAERHGDEMMKKRLVSAGVLGGSQILEGECSPEIERVEAIR